METIIQNTLQVNLYLILFYLIYAIFLRKETHFRLSRIYLVGGMLLAVAIPFITLPDFATQSVQESGLSNTAQELIYIPLLGNSQSEESNSLAWWLGVYSIGFCFMLGKFLSGIGGIVRLLRQSQKTWKGGYWLVNTSQAHEPFSFLNCLFWHKSDNVEAGEVAQIQQHELAHISQWHSLDILLFELLHIVFWYNPVCLLYKKSIRNIHEYLADDSTVGKLADKTSYSELLLGQFLQSDNLYLTSQFFNQSILKNRIMMLHKAKSKKSTMLKTLWAIPMIAICLLIHACGEKVLEPLATNDNYVLVKTFELPNSPSSTHNFKVLAKNAPLRLELKESIANTTFLLMDNKSNVLAKSIDGRISYKASVEGNYKVLAEGNGSNLKGKIEISALVKPKQDATTSDGFSDGYETVAKYNIGRLETEVYTIEVKEGENLSMRVFDKRGSAKDILVDVTNANGKRIGGNFYAGKYYGDMTLKCKETETLTFTITFKAKIRSSKLWLAKKTAE